MAPGKLQFKPKATPRTKEAAEASTKAAEAEQRRQQQQASSSSGTHRSHRGLSRAASSNQGRKNQGHNAEPQLTASGPFAFGPVGVADGKSASVSARLRSSRRTTEVDDTTLGDRSAANIKQEADADNTALYHTQDKGDEDEDDDGIPRIDLTQLQDYNLSSPHLLPISLPRHAKLPHADNDEARRHQHLGQTFNRTTSTDGFIFFQLPAVLPRLTLSKDPLPDNNDIDEPAYPPPNGTIGHLNVHRSGRTSITWGDRSSDITLQVHPGSECAFLQDVVVLDAVHQKKACLVGPVTDRFIVAPYV